jgi:hypothetical protein
MALIQGFIDMVKALINISPGTNWLLNVIKAQHNLKDKSQAIDMMAEEYLDHILDLPLKPAFIRRAKRLMKRKKTVPIGTIEDFDRMFHVNRTKSTRPSR